MNIKSLAKKINMDYDLLMEDYTGDVSLISDKINNFEKDAEFANLELAMAENDPEKISKAARKVKKTAEKLMIPSLYQAARTLQHATGNFSELFEDVLSEYNKVIKAIKEDN